MEGSDYTVHYLLGRDRQTEQTTSSLTFSIDEAIEYAKTYCFPISKSVLRFPTDIQASNQCDQGCTVSKMHCKIEPVRWVEGFAPSKSSKRPVQFVTNQGELKICSSRALPKLWGPTTFELGCRRTSTCTKRLMVYDTLLAGAEQKSKSYGSDAAVRGCSCLIECKHLNLRRLRLVASLVSLSHQ